MPDVTTYMAGDHRACDDRFAALENAVGGGDWDTAERESNAFLDAMERHFGLEEEVLFPEFERLTGMAGGPTQMMRMEHTQMRGLFEELRSGVAARDSDAVLGVTETLLVLMQQHNLKEEQILYPMTDQALGGAVDALVAQLQETGTG